MRVLLSTYGSRGDVEPLGALAVRLQELDAEVRMRVPFDMEFAELLAGIGAGLIPIGRPVRPVRCLRSCTGRHLRGRRNWPGTAPSYRPSSSTWSPPQPMAVRRWWPRD